MPLRASQSYHSTRTVDVFISADETATLIETVSDGASLTPMGEMMGAGGVKWFMVKTPAGNVGWIKAGANSAARQVDDHFRSLPKESTSIGPARNSPEGGSRTSAPGEHDDPYPSARPSHHCSGHFQRFCYRQLGVGYRSRPDHDLETDRQRFAALHYRGRNSDRHRWCGFSVYCNP